MHSPLECFSTCPLTPSLNMRTSRTCHCLQKAASVGNENNLGQGGAGAVKNGRRRWGQAAVKTSDSSDDPDPSGTVASHSKKHSLGNSEEERNLNQVWPRYARSRFITDWRAMMDLAGVIHLQFSFLNGAGPGIINLCIPSGQLPNYLTILRLVQWSPISQDLRRASITSANPDTCLVRPQHCQSRSGGILLHRRRLFFQGLIGKTQARSGEKALSGMTLRDLWENSSDTVNKTLVPIGAGFAVNRANPGERSS